MRRKDLEAVHPPQHNIEDYQILLFRKRSFDGSRPIVLRLNCEAPLQHSSNTSRS
jgi:hypothetical protein